MTQQKCLLCGREYPTGLHIMGCLICFPCEKRMLNETAAPPPSVPPRSLLKLYKGGIAMPR